MQAAFRLPNGRKSQYGYGWFAREINKVKMFSHGGNTAGSFASLFRVPSANLTIVLEGNVHDVGGDGIAQKVAEIYVPALRFVKLPEAKDPDPAATAKYIEVVRSLAARAPKAELLEPDMVARLQTGLGPDGHGRFCTIARRG